MTAPGPRLRILFVDDEPRILDGIMRMMRPMRHEWDIITAESGVQAIGLLEQSKVDVIVTDMRMPGMDGAELLELVALRHPHLVRIILSGQADRESLMRTIGPSHLYLAKPTDAQLLRPIITRACMLRDLLLEPKLQSIVSQISSLPTVPRLYLSIVEELRSPTQSIRRVGELVAEDIALSAKILQLVNSARFGIPQQINSPIEATVMLGIEIIRALVLTAHIIDTCTPTEASGIDGRVLVDHCVDVGLLAKAIAAYEHQSTAVADTCFTAGLLHDCGRLILSSRLPMEYGQVVKTALRDRRALCEVEREQLGAGHPEIGGYLLGLWGLPHALVEAVVFHHAPDRLTQTEFSPVIAVHAAQGIIAQRHDGLPLDTACFDLLGLGDRLPAWQALLPAAGQRSHH